MKNNQTNQKMFCRFGTPAKVVVDGHPVRESDIPEILEVLSHNPRGIKAFAVSRVNGVVKLFVARKPAVPSILEKRFNVPAREGAR